MVYDVIMNFRHAVKYRGWWGLIVHMYTQGDYPFKFGTYMGSDAAGNRYYENRVDYPFGQHRWVEPADIHNFESTQISPEWHGWMTSQHDATPANDEKFFEERMKLLKQGEISHVPFQSVIGHQEPYFNFNNQHNLSQVRSRGYGIGNVVCGLPPFAPDSFYTQPGSPYNPASIRKFAPMGDLDEAKGGGRPYKNSTWKRRLMKLEADAKAAVEGPVDLLSEPVPEKPKRLSAREEAIRARGGTLSR